MTVRDFHAIDGKVPAPDARFDVVVVGAGPAGTAAAIAAAADGASVLLIDENPVPGALIGSDVPYFYGGRCGLVACFQCILDLLDESPDATGAVAVYQCPRGVTTDTLFRLWRVRHEAL